MLEHQLILQEEGEIRSIALFFFLAFFPLDPGELHSPKSTFLKMLICVGYNIGLECTNQLVEHQKKLAHPLGRGLSAPVLVKGRKLKRFKNHSQNTDIMKKFTRRSFLGVKFLNFP
jgi:hypothetical protein